LIAVQRFKVKEENKTIFSMRVGYFLLLCIAHSSGKTDVPSLRTYQRAQQSVSVSTDVFG